MTHEANAIDDETYDGSNVTLGTGIYHHGFKKKGTIKKKTVVDSMGKVYLSINMVAYKLFVYSMGVFPE